MATMRNDVQGRVKERRDLQPLFNPSSVAILGASNDGSKWGNWLARRALLGEERRPVYLVNRRGGEVLGRPAYRSLREIPEPVELVVIAVPAAGFEAAVDEALQVGARAIVGISAGLGETGEEGRNRERSVVARIRKAGAVLLGPNCLGAFDAAAGLDLTSDGLPAGRIGLLSQSGNLALELSLLAQEAGLGFSRFAALGNQADLGMAELVSAFAADEHTDLIAIYGEDFGDGRAFASAAAGAVDTGKPVLLLTVGGSPASVRAARSHTGALVSDAVAVDAACRAAGIDRVASPREMIDLAHALLACPRPGGRRTGIIADGGGHGAIAAEVAHARGLEILAFSSELARRLAAGLPPTAATGNPVDLAGGGEQDIVSFDRTLRTLFDSGEVDAVLMTGYFGGYRQYSADLAEGELAVAAAMGETVAETGLPLIVHTMHSQSPAARVLRAAGVPVYRTIDQATWALGRLAGRCDRQHSIPSLPPPAEPITDTGYWHARQTITAAGIPVAEARLVHEESEAIEAASSIGYPVVLKALGSLHKSDAGGVVVGIADEPELRGALRSMQERLSPPSYSVECMAPLDQGVELLIGIRRDARFGPIVLVGLGGIYAEVLRDVQVALAPVDAAEAETLLRSLAGSRLLLGYRGRPAANLSALSHAIAGFSRLVAAHPEVAEAEINPVLATPDGVTALDARLVLRPATDQHEPS